MVPWVPRSEEEEWRKVVVSERRKAAAFPRSPFTGSRGQCFLLVWMGGEPWLRNQRGGTHSPGQDPSSPPATWTGPGDTARQAGRGQHSTGQAELTYMITAHCLQGNGPDQVPT